MIKMDNINEAFVEYSKIGKFPTVEFSDTNSLNEVLHRLDGGYTEYPSTLTGPQIVYAILDRVAEAQTDEYVGIKGYEVLDSIARTMADRISVCREYIKEIQSVASTLKQNIDTEYNARMKREGVGVVHLNLVSEKGTYPVLNWKGMDKLAPSKFIISELHDLAKIDSDVVTRTNVGPIYNILTNTLPAKLKGFNKIELSPDDLTTWKEYIKSKTDLTDTEISNYIRIITQPNRAKTFCQKQIGLLKRNTDCGDAIVDGLNSISDFVKLNDVINKGALPNRDKALSNLKIVMYYLNPTVYFLIMARNIICKDALLLDNKMINGDNVSSMEGAGITETDITTYLYYMQSSPKLPFTGIGLPTIIAFKPKLSERRKKDQTKSELQIKFKTNQIKRSVVKQVLSAYTKDQIASENRNPEINIKAKINRVCDEILLGDVNISDVLFKFILDLSKDHEFTAILYKRLGASYMRLLTEKKSIDSEDVLIAETGVFTKLVVEFILGTFCKK